MPKSLTLKAAHAATLLATLEARFATHPERHPAVDWKKVRARLDKNAAAMWSLGEMERTEGEPDVVGLDPASGAYVFVDCATQSPRGRRSLCYDRAARDARKEHKPKGSAQELAAAMGVRILDEAEYRVLQDLGDFDTTTSSWIATPAPVRKLGGALFCDRRYNKVFTYHNGAESYYAARGFRASVPV